MLSTTNRAWHTKEITEIYKLLKTSEKGLSDQEAKERLAVYGNNQLMTSSRKPLWKLIIEQIGDPMIMILIGAAIFSACFSEWTEAIVIFTIVIVNGVIGIWQEKKAESSLEALRQIGALKARVFRNGKEMVIDGADLVPGDIVSLEDGMKVPADIRLISSSQLMVQEAALTGESLPVEKNGTFLLDEACSLGDRKNMLYSSSVITYGRGFGIVVATGMSTEVGKIAALLESQESLETPMKRKLAHVGKVLTLTGVIVCILVFLIGALYQRPWLSQLLVAISLAVSVIPEGLPATATVVMALGVGRMSKKNALISQLSAVETLGNATVICSDKTGTLTRNQMTVTHLVTANELQEAKIKKLEVVKWQTSQCYHQLALSSLLCNNASISQEDEGKVIGDPTEGALILMGREAGLLEQEIVSQHLRVFEIPFDSIRKRMTTIHQGEEGYTAYTKGAVDEMLPFCSHLLTDQGIEVMTDKNREAIMNLNKQMAANALRVLGFAMKSWKEQKDWEKEAIEEEMIFIGMVGMIDPPRQEVVESIRVCHEAGIKTIMITGDHSITAQAIAKELGVWKQGDKVLAGQQLDEISEAQLVEEVKHTTVFARVSPTDKLRVIKALRQNGEVVAMTGDGVNDAPALKSADIGVAMGITGTDVAKEAADMILLDDSFTTIAAAIKEGRRVYRNIQKVIQFLLAGNIAEMITFLVATVFNLGAPLQAVHILWVNLATATLPALALGVDPPSKNIMKHQPVKAGTLFEKDLVRRVIVQGIFVATMTLLAFWLGRYQVDEKTGQTMAFCVLAFSQLLRSLNQRSNTEPIWIRAEAKNPWLVGAFIVSVLLVLTILLVPSLQLAFGIARLNCKQWVIVVMLTLLSVVQMEIYKWLKLLMKRGNKSEC